jgi:hypothetical protein
MELIKKSVLKTEYDYSFHLWGIVTTIKDFQACWEINNILKINLQRKEDIELQNAAKGRQMFFGLFSCKDRYGLGSFHFVANKYYNEFLIPEMKEIDFFLRYTCESSDDELKQLHHALKSIRRFALVVKINPLELKSRHQLILD